MKKIILLFIAAFVSIAIQAQPNPSILFKKTTLNLGEIKEKANEVKACFKFKNIGNAPLLIETVRPSCGCTTADYTKTLVMPGKTGKIETIYHTKNNIGSFHKSIIVYTNDTANKVIILYLDGKVIQKGESFNDEYPQAMGNISFKSNHVAFNNIKNTAIKTEKLWFYNSSNKKIDIQFTNIPDWLLISKKVLKIKPRKERHVSITYNAVKKNDWGLNFDKIIMRTNDDTLAEKTIFVSAQIEEDFSQLTPQQLNDAPKIVFDNINYEFGEIKEGKNIQHDFIFTNTGKTDLIVRKIKSSCECLSITSDKMIIKAGESSKIDIVFYTKDNVGEQQKTITIVTNDPNNSSTVLSLIGVVNN